MPIWIRLWFRVSCSCYSFLFEASFRIIEWWIDVGRSLILVFLRSRSLSIMTSRSISVVSYFSQTIELTLFEGRSSSFMTSNSKSSMSSKMLSSLSWWMPMISSEGRISIPSPKIDIFSLAVRLMFPLMFPPERRSKSAASVLWGYTVLALST